MSYGLYTFDPQQLADECDAEIFRALHAPNRVDELERLEANRPNLLMSFIERSHDHELLAFLAQTGNRHTRGAALQNQSARLRSAG